MRTWILAFSQRVEILLTTGMFAAIIHWIRGLVRSYSPKIVTKDTFKIHNRMVYFSWIDYFLLLVCLLQLIWHILANNNLTVMGIYMGSMKLHKIFYFTKKGIEDVNNTKANISTLIKQREKSRTIIVRCSMFQV